jgi:pilus assembly protein Flp/PilA
MRQRRAIVLFNRFIADQSGVTVIEYALLGSIMAVAIVVWATMIGTSVSNTFTTIAGYFPSG